MTIVSPLHPIGHPDRSIDCAAALEPAIQSLEQAAIAAGWTPDEVAIALVDLGKNAFLAFRENERTQVAVDVAALLDRLRGQGA